MFPVEYIIDLQLNYCYNNRRGIKLKASLECKESSYILRFHVQSDYSDIISFDTRNMVSKKVKSTFRIYKAFIDNKEVDVKWEDAIITHIETRWEQGESETQWAFTIDSFKVTIPNEKSPFQNINERSKWFLSQNKFVVRHLKVKQSDLNSNKNVYVPQYYIIDGTRFGLCQDVKLNYPILYSNSENKKALVKFLKCVSFFYGCNISGWLLEETKDNTIEFSYSIKSIIPPNFACSQLWDYYRTDTGKRITLESFISSVNGAIGNMEAKKVSILFKSIRSFTNSLNASAQHKLTDYCAIILSVAQFMHKFTHSQDIELAKAINEMVGIDYKKLNGDLCEKGFHRTNDNNKGINNYIELRHEVIHGLPSDEILGYLENSFIVNRLEHATFVTILYECGFRHLQYIRPFHEFNVLLKDTEYRI